MSQPNDPDKKTSPSPAKGPTASGASDDVATTTSIPTAGSPSGASPSTSGPQPGPQRGGLVPPWQRGPGGPDGTNPVGSAQAPMPSGSAPTEQIVNGRGGTPRGVVTGSGTAAASMSGQQAPVKKLDAPPVGPAAPTTEAPRGRFVETPTRTIAREPSAGEKLPDLDEIHHTSGEATRAGAAAAAAGVATRSAPTQVGSGRALRAAVQVRRLDPWATFKVVGVLAIVGFVIWMIAVAVLYLVLDGMGVWEQVNSSFGTLVTADGATSGDIIGAGSVFLYAGILGVVNGILITALATIGAYIYNLVADMVGGLEVTLADLD
ncbi:DUF3566 domain-containing protein [Gordonia sp. VNQ95]|uniref:DUF3566 domain-containing protein n=1 Tax=Gordonia sp. VNQ95 TaxID=3156619 RepID=UPI0032B3BAD7